MFEPGIWNLDPGIWFKPFQWELKNLIQNWVGSLKGDLRNPRKQQSCVFCQRQHLEKKTKQRTFCRSGLELFCCWRVCRSCGGSAKETAKITDESAPFVSDENLRQRRKTGGKTTAFSLTTSNHGGALACQIRPTAAAWPRPGNWHSPVVGWVQGRQHRGLMCKPCQQQFSFRGLVSIRAPAWWFSFLCFKSTLSSFPLKWWRKGKKKKEPYASGDLLHLHQWQLTFDAITTKGELYDDIFTSYVSESVYLRHSNCTADAVAPRVICNVLTMSSVASLAAVTDSTRISGTTVVNQDSEEIWGITWRARTRTHTINPNLFLTRWGNFLSWMLLSIHPRPV